MEAIVDMEATCGECRFVIGARPHHDMLAMHRSRLCELVGQQENAAWGDPRQGALQERQPFGVIDEVYEDVERGDDIVTIIRGPTR